GAEDQEDHEGRQALAHVEGEPAHLQAPSARWRHSLLSRSFPSTKPATCLFRRTMIRWHRATSSSRSDDVSTIDVPSEANWAISRWISWRAPTSTPTVGSSRTRTRRGLRNHRPITAFCWLPPERVLILASTLGATIDSWLLASSANRRSRFVSTHPPRETRLPAATVRFSRTESTGNTPSVSRSSGTIPSPASQASDTDRSGRSVQPSCIDPPE